MIAPEASSFRNDAGGKRWHVVQGEFAVTDDPEVMLGTILGSCVAACMHDPVARVGGMNHFLLPGEKGANSTGAQSAVTMASKSPVRSVTMASACGRSSSGHGSATTTASAEWTW